MVNLPFGGAQSKATLDALGKSFAVIEFSPTGEILRANDTFCECMGYSPDALRGQHHRIFADPALVASDGYREFWKKLSSGEYDSGEYKRLKHDGSVIWLRASYTPVCDARGKVVKVIKLALDVTDETMKAAEDASLIRAIDRSQAMIAFGLDGTILEANDNFLATVGYGRDEIVGKKHSMFADSDYASSTAYSEFWARLSRGEFFSDEFRRLGKGGREVWLQATYNPIFDADGKIKKVVKFATDLTERMRNIEIVGDALSALAAGDLDVRVNESLMPSLDKLRTDFNATAQALYETLSVVSTTMSAIDRGVDEIAQASDDLSRRTEQQAASLQQTATALDEITVTVSKTAEGARHSAEVVGATREQAERSGEVVRNAVSAMGEIEDSSRQISQIIGVIDEIAFQTNLLALNAGVEAARAGDAGRGFAVVASEVRALAQRTADAAKEIKTLISSSSQQVENGVSLVGGAGTALQQILEQVSQIEELVSQISSSAQEQSTGLHQVNAAVNQMDQIVQQNAAMVEESTAATHTLKGEAAELTALVSRFRMSASSDAQPARADAGRKVSRAA